MQMSLFSQLFEAVQQHEGFRRQEFEDMVNNAPEGVTGGYHGWCYYNEIDLFYNKNETLIYQLLDEFAENGGQTIAEVVCGISEDRSPQQRRADISYWVLNWVAEGVMSGDYEIDDDEFQSDDEYGSTHVDIRR